VITAPPPTGFILLLGLSFFLGLAFEDFFKPTKSNLPGGIRTFPMLALAGGVLYLFDPAHFIPFTGGLLVLGAWLVVRYVANPHAAEESGEPSVGLVVPVLNVHAYLLGAVALALPPWVAVAITVTSVLLLTSRERLHALAQQIEIREIIIAGEFLILIGIIFPLLPNEPVTTLTKITPRQVWLALVVVCSFSYASYLAQRYWAAAAGGLWMAALGGLYSSTATTVVLARQAATQPASLRAARAGITLASGIMYLRILAIIAILNWPLATSLVLPLAALALAAMVICAFQYWYGKPASAGQQEAAVAQPAKGNPLEIGPAAIFAAAFILISLASTWASQTFGANGIYWLAAIVGISDIDPFVLNLAQGGIPNLSNEALAAAILIAASSNNVLKAIYAASFAGGRTASSATALIALAVAGVAAALAIARFYAV
jgi:uncharacterized membrane protein (DUF4010 family)